MAELQFDARNLAATADALSKRFSAIVGKNANESVEDFLVRRVLASYESSSVESVVKHQAEVLVPYKSIMGMTRVGKSPRAVGDRVTTSDGITQLNALDRENVRTVSLTLDGTGELLIEVTLGTVL